MIQQVASANTRYSALRAAADRSSATRSNTVMIYLSSHHNREAKAILRESLLTTIKNDFASLRKMPETEDPIHIEVAGESGHEYQVEITSCQDDENLDVLVVTGMIADGYLSSYISMPPFTKSLSVSMTGDILDGQNEKR